MIPTIAKLGLLQDIHIRSLAATQPEDALRASIEYVDGRIPPTSRHQNRACLRLVVIALAILASIGPRVRFGMEAMNIRRSTPIPMVLISHATPGARGHPIKPSDGYWEMLTTGMMSGGRFDVTPSSARIGNRTAAKASYASWLSQTS